MAVPIEIAKIPSPAFVLEEEKLIRNLELIADVQERAGVTIILALKAFAMWPVFPLVGQYLKGATASSLAEARLIYEEMGRKAHTYSPAYLPDEFDELLRYSSHITFNSLNQFHHYREQVEAHEPAVSMGLRVNPEYSEVEVDLYNPASPIGRLGETAPNVPELPGGIEGLHFHALCESTSFALEGVLQAFEGRFGHFLPQLKWVNFGGGHLMTREGYDREHLIQLLKDFRQRYPHLEVIMEPGSAIAWQTGILRSKVLDLVENHSVKTAVLDVSFTAHMPDTLEMPYRPVVRGANSEPGGGKPAYRLGGVSCLAGDFMSEYEFESPLEIGDDIILEDMIHYTIVKTTMFNGVKHPDIAIWRKDGSLDILRKFTYEDFKNRLG